MSKPLRIPAIVAPSYPRQPALIAPAPATVILSLKLRREKKRDPRQMPFDHDPGPQSIILLKIIAMETYSANLPRLARRRQFCKRLGSP